MHKRLCLLLPVLPLLLIAAVLRPTPAAELDETITIIRDSFGVPNIFAQTDEGAVFGMGYAQAEDRLEQIMTQYRRAEGTMAEVFGPEHLKEDYKQRVWQHRAVAEANYPKLSPKVRAICESYQAGIQQYMNEHPEKVPSWAPKLAPWQVVALGRYIIWRWPMDDAGGDLKRGGITPDPVDAAGSNQWVVTPSRTADGAPIALIDPHLSWYGHFRYFEARLYGDKLANSGVCIPGLPLASLGHNRFLSVACTTGGPDACDVYMETVNPANPKQYQYDGQWKEFTTRKEVINVKEGNNVVSKTFEIQYSHHGPVVAHKDGKAYAMAVPYFQQFRLAEQSYAMATATNLDEMKKALSMLQLMEQNVMIATVQGDIFYVRNGRVPIRPKGEGDYDWRRPVQGNTSKTEWEGIHDLNDLVQLYNPWQGYMQNCNVSPEHMTFNCPMTPQRYKDRIYLYNTDNPLHQRAAMTRAQLHANTRLTLPEALEIAMSTQVFNADLWQARLAAAWGKQGGKIDAASTTAKMYDLIMRWNRRSDADSVGAIAYKFWFDELGGKAGAAARGSGGPPNDVADDTLVNALTSGGNKLLKKWGRLEVKYGEVYRVGRQGGKKTWPVGGGTIAGMATPRAIGFQPQKDGKTYIGVSGQTSTQVVQLTNPPKSWTLLPLGESDDPKSPHFDDMAEKLFSPGKLKPTYFLQRAELERVASSTKNLQWKR